MHCLHLLVCSLAWSGARSSSSSLHLLSSCTGASSVQWNTDTSTMGPAVRSWLGSVVTRRGEWGGEEDSVQSMLYHPHTGEWSEHFAHYNDQMEENNHLVDTDRRVVTIGTFGWNVPMGLTWQWRSKRIAEGFLYGEVDNRGQFTGEDITYVYPDFLTGLRGKFVHGVLEEATAVDIIGERCMGGKKELLIKPAARDSSVVWEKDEKSHWHIGKNPLVMDPYESKSVYVGNSQVPGSDEGLFARRPFLPGDIVSLFSGTNTFASNMFFNNMTDVEISNAGSYYFNLAANVPEWWGYPEDMVLDVPEQYRSIYQFRTTLGHKANHLFEGKNTEYDTVNHPVHGGIVCLIATSPIQADEEVYVDYLYDVDDAEPWYRELYYRTYPDTE